MIIEIKILALAALLQIVQYALFSLTANPQVGLKYSLGPRDNPRQLTGIAGRLGRALDNHAAALPLFAIGVFMIAETNQSTPVTQFAAWIYLCARIAYLPAYALGLSPWRSVFWAIGLCATATLFIATLI